MSLDFKLEHVESLSSMARELPSRSTAEYPRGLLPVPEFDPNKLSAQLEAAPELTARADRAWPGGPHFDPVPVLKHGLEGHAVGDDQCRSPP